MHRSGPLPYILRVRNKVLGVKTAKMQAGENLAFANRKDLNQLLQSVTVLRLGVLTVYKFSIIGAHAVGR